MYVKGAKLKSRQVRTEKGLVCLETVQKGRVSWYRGQITGLGNAMKWTGVLCFYSDNPRTLLNVLSGGVT